MYHIYNHMAMLVVNYQILYNDAVNNTYGNYANMHGNYDIHVGNAPRLKTPHRVSHF